MKIVFKRDHFDFKEGDKVDFSKNIAQAEYFISMGVAEAVIEDEQKPLEKKKSK